MIIMLHGIVWNNNNYLSQFIKRRHTSSQLLKPNIITLSQFVTCEHVPRQTFSVKWSIINKHEVPAVIPNIHTCTFYFCGACIVQNHIELVIKNYFFWFRLGFTLHLGSWITIKHYQPLIESDLEICRPCKNILILITWSTSLK